MATKLFLRETTNSGIGTYRDMVTTAGSASTTGVVNTVASGSEILWTKTAGGAVLEWISGRSPAGGWTLSGAVTFSIWAHESNNLANCGGRARLFKRTAAGSETEIGSGPWNDGVEFTKNTPTEMLWSGTPTPTTFAENDRLVARYYITNVGTMGGGYTCTLTYDAADAATGDSFVQLTETVAFKAESTTYNEAFTLGNSDGISLSAVLDAFGGLSLGASGGMTFSSLLDAQANLGLGTGGGLVVAGGLTLDSSLALGSSLGLATSGGLDLTSLLSLAASAGLTPSALLDAFGGLPLGMGGGIVSISVLDAFGGLSLNSVEGLTFGAVLDAVGAVSLSAGLTAGFAGTLDLIVALAFGSALGLTDLSVLDAFGAVGLGLGGGFVVAGQWEGTVGLGLGIGAALGFSGGLDLFASMTLAAGVAVNEAGTIPLIGYTALGAGLGVVFLADFYTGKITVLRSQRASQADRHVAAATVPRVIFAPARRRQMPGE